MLMRAQLLGDFAPPQAALSKRARVLSVARSISLFVCENRGRAEQWTERRHDEIFDVRFEVVHSCAAVGAAMSCVSACRTQAIAPRGGASSAQA
jgi:hypothetical protein